MNKFILNTMRQARRAIVAVVGFTVLLIGVAMIVMPGPAVVIIPIGLGILASEFIWARNLLRKIKSKISRNKKGESKHEAE